MSVARHTAYGFLASLVPVVVTIAVTPLLLKVVGVDRFGLLAIFWTLLGSMHFASLGMGPAVSSRLGTLAGSASRERSQLVWTALLLSSLAAMVGALLVLATGHVYFRYFAQGTAALQREITQALPLLSLLLPLGLIVSVLNGALQGRHFFGWQSISAVLNSTLLSVLPLAVSYLHAPTMISLVGGMIIAQCATLVFQLRLCRDLVPLEIPQRPDGLMVRDLLSFGAWMSATTFIAPFVTLLDRFVIGALRGPSAVAAYTLPYNLVQRMVTLPVSLHNATLPRFAAMTRADEERQLQKESIELLNGVLTPAAVIGIALAGPFFEFWVGTKLGSAAAPVGVILIVGGWAHGIGHIPSTVLLGRNRPDMITKLLLILLVPYVLALLAATTFFGITGAAAVWTLRASIEPLMFYFTRPDRQELLSIAKSALLLTIAMVIGLSVPWRSGVFWTVMCVLIGFAVFKSWSMVSPMLLKLRGPGSGLVH